MIYHGDLFDVLPTLPECSIDACVTDPPYELGFMGRKWDRSGVSVRPETWREVLRVLKPGAFLVAFGGTRTFHRMTVAIEDAGFEVRDILCWLYGSGFPKSYNLGDGKGTALKPAYEPIVLAWKPFKGSIKACHKKHGTSALNIDACRVEPSISDDYGRSVAKADGSRSITRTDGYGFNNAIPYKPGDMGRWPANVLLDEEAAVMLDEQSGELKAGEHPKGMQGRPTNVYGVYAGFEREHRTVLDTGGASRFYYVAKPSQEERSFGVDRNTHPTVKPVELMRWLVRLVTPINGTVLDPFTGSGTTGMACRYELRDFVGIEREAEYVAIAERRISAVAPLFGEHTA